MPYLSSHQLQRELKSHKIVLEKHKSQCFIINREISETMWQLLDCDAEKDVVLEVGPGFGAFSDKLIQHSAKYYCIEKDPQISRYLEHYYINNYHYPTNRITERELEYLGRIPEKKNISVMIIEGDALKIPFPKVNKIISNLPFEISYEFLLRLLEYGDFKKSVLILQKEVVETLLKDARVHGYGLLSVIAGLYWNISIEKQLRSSDFFPSPEVDTEIISIKFKPQSEQYFEKRSDFILFLRGIMRYKNKILRNAVKLWLKHEKVAKNAVDYSKFIQLFPNLKALQTNSDYNSFSDIPVRQITPSRLFDLFSLASSFPKN